MARKAMQQGFDWPKAMADAEYIVKTCEACQFHAKNIHQPAQALQTIPLSWLFAVWGLDVVGNFPRAVGGYQYLIVVVDKFTKMVRSGTHQGTDCASRDQIHPRNYMPLWSPQSHHH